MAAGDGVGRRAGSASVPGRRRRLHRLRLRCGAGAPSPDAVRRPRPARRRARPLRLGDRLGPAGRRRLARLTGRTGASPHGAGASGIGGGAVGGVTRPLGSHGRAARAAPAYASDAAADIGLRSTFTHRGYLDRRGEGPRVHRRGRHLPGQPLPALPGAAAGAAVRPVPPAAPPEPGAVRGLPRLRRRDGAQRLARALPPAGSGRAGRDQADQGHATPGPRPDARRGAGSRPGGEREGPRGERHDRGPAPQRSQPGLPARNGAGARAVRAGAASDRAPPGLHRAGRPGAGRRRRGPGPRRLPRRLDHRRAEGPGDGDHRRAGAHPAGRVLRLDRLPERHGGDGHEHRDPDVRGSATASSTSRPAVASWPTPIRSWSTGRRWTRRRG